MVEYTNPQEHYGRQLCLLGCAVRVPSPRAVHLPKGKQRQASSTFETALGNQVCTYRIRVRRCTPHPSAPIFHARYLHNCNSVRAKKVGVEIISPRAFRRRIVRYWHWHPLGCRAIGLGKPPQGGMMYTVVYGMTNTASGMRHTSQPGLLG